MLLLGLNILWTTLYTLSCFLIRNAHAIESIPQQVLLKPTSHAASSCKLKGATGNLGEGFGPNLGSPYVPSVGTLNAYMIFIDFPDTPANDSIDTLHSHFVPGAPDWYNRASFGKLNLHIKADRDRFYRMPHNSTSYTYRRGMSGEDHIRYIQDALYSVGGSINFTGTDLLYIVPTAAATHISYSPTCLAPVVAADGTWIRKSVTFGQDMYFWGFTVMNHETGHTMGLPDLYPGRWNPGPVGQYVGGFDLMANNLGASPDHFAWHKWRLGWFSDDQFDCLTEAGSTEHLISAVEVQEGKKAVIVKYNETTALIAEVRSGAGLNREACGTGVLIYIVYANIESGLGPVVVLDSRPNSGGCKGEELNDAPFQPGDDPFVSTELGVTITVKDATESDCYNVRVEVH